MLACIICEGVSFGRGERIVSLHTHVYVYADARSVNQTDFVYQEIILLSQLEW